MVIEISGSVKTLSELTMAILSQATVLKVTADEETKAHAESRAVILESYARQISRELDNESEKMNQK